MMPDPEKMQKLGRMIVNELHDLGFCLLVFEFSDVGMANYISNTIRQDMIKALREAADRLEKNRDFRTPRHN